jgi:hypothetical protein
MFILALIDKSTLSAMPGNVYVSESLAAPPPPICPPNPCYPPP